MKYLLIIFAFLLCMSIFASCTMDSDSESEPTLISGATPEYDNSLITVGFIQIGRESAWRDANTNDFINTFTEDRGFNLIFVDGNSSIDRQAKAMYDLVNQKVDYIVLAPLIEDGWDEVMQEAYNAGIPVILTDRHINQDNSMYTSWIGSDFEVEGEKAATWLADYLANNGRDQEIVNIVILEGTEGSSAAVGRTKGLNRIISQHSNWRVLTSISADFTQGQGQIVMNEILEQYPDIDVLISENDNMMFGAMKAMDMKDITYGVDGTIITISFDAVHEAFEKMIDRKLHLSVECNPLLAELTASVILKLEQGLEINRINYSEEGIFTFENAAYYLPDRKY